jgi:hypothetical protein
MVRTRTQFKLDVRSQQAQGIYKNTSNSLTGASASSAGAIHYTTTTPPSNPMVMTRRGASSAIVAQMHGIRKKAMAKHVKAHKKAHKKLHKKSVRHYRHRAGTEKRKGAAYCTRRYRK